MSIVQQLSHPDLAKALEQHVDDRAYLGSSLAQYDGASTKLAIAVGPLQDPQLAADLHDCIDKRIALNGALAALDASVATFYSHAKEHIELVPQQPGTITVTPGGVTTLPHDGEVPPPPNADPTTYGCPPDVKLLEWTVKLVEGGGRPTAPGGGTYSLIPDWKPGAHLTGFRLTSTQPGFYCGPTGVAGPGLTENIRVSNAILEKLAKWHGRPHLVKGLVVEHVSDLYGPEEHDWYIEPIGGQPVTGICFLLRNGYSYRAGSQRFQLAQRTRDGVTEAMYVDGGMVVIQDDLCVDHARHVSEGGTGTRPSQAYKFFSAQVGPAEGQEKNRLLKHYILMQRVILDDTMQKYSHGAALIGANKGTVILNSSFRGGALNGHPQEKSYEAIRVESWIAPEPVGPLLIEDTHLEYASGENGQGIKLFDNRPVKITGCTGNLRIYDGITGAVLGHVAQGFERNWSPAAQAVVDQIKAAGASL